MSGLLSSAKTEHDEKETYPPRTSHFWDYGEIKDNGEAKGEFGDGEVDPLDRFQEVTLSSVS